MADGTLYQSGCIVVEVRETDPHVLWFGIRQSPNLAELQKLSTIVGTWVNNTNNELVFWFEHTVKGGTLNAPDLASIIHVISKLLEYRDSIQGRLVCTCLQARALDDTLLLLKDQFLAMYKPIAPFDILVGQEAATVFVQKCIRNRREKKK